MKELTVEAKAKSIPVVTEFVNRELRALHCPTRIQAQIDVVIDELLANVAFYAYQPDTGSVTIRMEVEEEPPTMILTFIDEGRPFNPLERKDPNTKLPARERKIGGLGIFMVKKSMDDVSYEYKDGKNILRIEKHI